MYLSTVMCLKFVSKTCLWLYVTSFLAFCSVCLDCSLPVSGSLLRKECKTHVISLWGLRDRIMADYEDYEVVIFSDFKDFTRQFEKKEEGKSDPNIHQKTKANSLFSNCDYCPQPPMSTLAPVFPLAFEFHRSYPYWKWIPETQVCATLCE